MAEIPAGYDPMGPTPVGLPDKKGNPFNPSIHQVYKTGRAFLNRVGEWVLKGGRPKKDAPPVSAPEKTPEKAPEKVVLEGLPAPVDEGDLVKDAIKHSPKAIPNTPPVLETIPQGQEIKGLESVPQPPAGMPPVSPQASVENAQLEASARSAVVLAEGILVMTFGQSQTHSKEERETRLNEWKLFLQDKPGFSLPPWAVLVLGYGLQVAARADKPDFQKRCAAWGARFKKWFGRG